MRAAGPPHQDCAPLGPKSAHTSDICRVQPARKRLRRDAPLSTKNKELPRVAVRAPSAVGNCAERRHGGGVVAALARAKLAPSTRKHTRVSHFTRIISAFPCFLTASSKFSRPPLLRRQTAAHAGPGSRATLSMYSSSTRSKSSFDQSH